MMQLKACHSAAVPDKHKEAMRFMEPLAQELLKCLEAKAPVKNHDVVDELVKAKAKMAEHGILEDHMSLKKWSLELPRKAFFYKCLGKALAKALSLSPFLKWDIYRGLVVRNDSFRSVVN